MSTTGRVDLEWHIGEDGMGNTYSFYPRPSITRPVAGEKIIELKVPLLNGSVTQLLGLDSTHITLKGALVQQNGNFDDLDEQRTDLIAGLDRTQPGQLHLISNKGNANSQDVYYIGIVTKIDFASLENSYILDYTIDILLADPTEQETM